MAPAVNMLTHQANARIKGSPASFSGTYHLRWRAGGVRARRAAACPCRRQAASSAAVPDLDLQFNTLGSSDLRVSDVCLGSMTWGQQNTVKEAHEQLAFATDVGINFLDTAELYPVVPHRDTQGRTSEYIGTWLKSHPREKVIVASKVAGVSEWLTWIPANRTVPRGEETYCRVDAASIKAAVEGELRRLQTDYIDLMQIHWPDRYLPLFGKSQYQVDMEREEATPFVEQVEAMHDLIKEGKIRHWGLSNESSFGVMRHIAAADMLGAPRPVTIQNSFSLITRTFESELAEVCSPSNCNLGLLPWSALAGGALTGKYCDLGEDELANSRFRLFPGRYDRFDTPEVHVAVKHYARIAQEAGLTPAQLAYAFCRSRWFIPSTIVGATSMDQLTDNLGAFTKKARLSPEMLDAIEEVHRQNRNPTLRD